MIRNKYDKINVRIIKLFKTFNEINMVNERPNVRKKIVTHLAQITKKHQHNSVLTFANNKQINNQSKMYTPN